MKICKSWQNFKAFSGLRKSTIWIVSLSIFSGCLSADHSSISILVSGNTNGVIEPCDCEVGPLGGLAKRATLIRKLDASNKMLRLDCGGIVDELTDPGRYAKILEAYRTIGYHAIIPGESDNELWRMAIASGDSSWKTGVGPYHYVCQGWRIDVYALSQLWLDSIYQWLSKETGNLSTPTDSLGRNSPAKERSDHQFDRAIIIWLTYLDEEELAQVLTLALKLGKPDLILAGNSDLAVPAPDTLLGVPLFRCGVDGMDLLQVSITIIDSTVAITPHWHEVGVKIGEAKDIRAILKHLQAR